MFKEDKSGCTHLDTGQKLLLLCLFEQAQYTNYRGLHLQNMLPPPSLKCFLFPYTPFFSPKLCKGRKVELSLVFWHWFMLLPLSDQLRNNWNHLYAWWGLTKKLTKYDFTRCPGQTKFFSGVHIPSSASTVTSWHLLETASRPYISS